MRKQTYYEVLGVPTGASIEHVRDSYRLLTNKSLFTDAAYNILSDPTLRREYDNKLLSESNAPRMSTNQEDDYYVVKDDASWHLLRDKDVGWELESFLPDGSIRLKAPRTLFGPFSINEAEEFAERKKSETAKAIEGNETPRTIGSWIEYGAPTEMPQKPALPTHTELSYITGIEKIFRAKFSIDMPDKILEYTPEELFAVSGVLLETQTDLNFFVQYVQWLDDVVMWHKSLSTELAATVTDALGTFSKGRYKFLTLLFHK